MTKKRPSRAKATRARRATPKRDKTVQPARAGAVGGGSPAKAGWLFDTGTVQQMAKNTDALGMIEVKGFVTLVEAGANAAQQVGELVASHVIPRPADTLVASFFS